MSKWLFRSTVVAVVLHCLGCAADTMDPQPAGMRHATEVHNDGGQEAAANRASRDPDGLPAMRPMLADAQKARDPAASAYLATEATMIEQDGISGERSDEILEDTALFSKALARMSDDEKTSMEAQELARHHRNVLVRAVGDQGVVEDLTCGLSLCMGAVTARSQVDHDAWHGRLAKDPAARRYGAIHRFEPVGDQVQKRFVFSADPAVAAIYMDR